MQQVNIFTDGGFRAQKNIGSWGYHAVCQGKVREDAGYGKNVTNNQMELTAIIKSLEMLNEPCEVTVHTDSMYAVNGFNKWMDGWSRNEWKSSKGLDIKNQSYWLKLQELKAYHDVDIVWVKAHSGVAGNTQADYLCNYAMDMGLGIDTKPPERFATENDGDIWLIEKCKGGTAVVQFKETRHLAIASMEDIEIGNVEDLD